MDAIVEEYLLSEGEIKKEQIRSALENLEPLEKYFHRSDLNVVRREILGRP
jgi:hypothetical protein